MQTNRLFARFAQPSNDALGHAALALRVGLGSVFIILTTLLLQNSENEKKGAVET